MCLHFLDEKQNKSVLSSCMTRKALKCGRVSNGKMAGTSLIWFRDEGGGGGEGEEGRDYI